MDRMNPARTLIVLGSGTSVGVPVIGCDCAICTSPDPKHSRTRPSVLLQLPAGNILIDTSPELRIQLVRERIGLVHAVLYTHYHVDHLFGLDDVRVFPRRLGHSLPIYCTDEVEEVIRQVFSYAFHPPAANHPAIMLPQLEFQRIDARPLEILGLPIQPIPLIHGRFNVLGFRVGDLAYCTDVNKIPDSSWPLLEGLDTLFLDAVRPGESLPSHFGLDEALQAIERIRPRRAYLTHLSHTMDEQKLNLPPNVQLAYDGLRVEF
jgi:phosphoribosyl 1,2-cyclic phosphate phosphodiesterase